MTAPGDRSRFLDVIDCLFKILYEGAGGDKLRFLTTVNSGLMMDTECQVVWAVKALRQDARHDQSHGGCSAVRRKRDTLARQIRFLGLEHLPFADQHFGALHLRLLEETKAFLEAVVTRLAGLIT